MRSSHSKGEETQSHQQWCCKVVAAAVTERSGAPCLNRIATPSCDIGFDFAGAFSRGRTLGPIFLLLLLVGAVRPASSVSGLCSDRFFGRSVSLRFC